MYGSKMDKWTTIKATASLYDAICKQCDGSHTHDSWRPSMGPNGPTTGQSEYPIELRKEMSNCLAKFLVNKGTKFVDANLSQQTSLAPRQLRVHGRKQLPPLLAEYWMICDSVIAKQFPSYKQLKQLPPTCEKWGVIFVQQDERHFIILANHWKSSILGVCVKRHTRATLQKPLDTKELTEAV